MRPFTDQRGMVLVIALFILALTIGAGVGAIVSTQTDLKTSANIKTLAQAFYIAEAGIHHARQELQDGDGASDFGPVYAAANGTVIVSNTSFNGGSYTVTREGSGISATDSRIKIVSVGTGPNNSRSRIEAWVRRELGKPPRAIMVRDKLEIRDSVKLLGVCGGAHANDELDVDSGTPAIEMPNGLTASDELDIDGDASPCIGSAACANSPPPSEFVIDTSSERGAYEQANDDAPAYSFPPINAADYASLVAGMGPAGNHYILHGDGMVTTGGSCADGDCSGGTAVSVLPAGWIFVDDKWVVSGSTAANGVFYSETTVEISGSPGSDTSPWEATIISRGDLKVTTSSSPRMRPYSATSRELKNHLFVTDDDLTIEGDLKANYAPGAILVKDKFVIGGNTTIRGFILSRDSSAENRIKDSVQITYSCDVGCAGPGCPLSTAFATVGWMQKF